MKKQTAARIPGKPLILWEKRKSYYTERLNLFDFGHTNPAKQAQPTSQATQAQPTRDPLRDRYGLFRKEPNFCTTKMPN